VRGWTRKAVGYVGAAAVMVVAWELASLAMHSPALPTPADGLGEFAKQFPVLLPHFGVSTLRVVSSILLGLVVGAPLGLVLGRSERADVIFGPLVFLNYPVPKVVFLPVLLVLLGIGNASIIALITLIVFFQILVTARDAARSLSSAAVLSVRSLGAGRWQVFTNVVVPGSMPEIFTALRISVGTAVAVLFFSETIAGSTGLGYFVFDAWGRVQYGEMFAGILAMALLGVLLYEAIELIEARVCRWARAGR
jgi:ABC-type nitrate/sulfonate/bicarbonate transport system permease component